MTFDYIVANPPFKGKGDPVYMRITQKSLDLLKWKGTAIMLNPTVWIDTKKYKNPNTLYTKYYGLPMYKMEDVSSEDFNIRLATHLGIFCYNYTKPSIKINELSWRNETNPILAKSIFEKCCTREGIDCNILRQNSLKKNNKQFMVILAGIRGNIYSNGVHKWDWPTFSSTEYLHPILKTEDIGNASGAKTFDSLTQAENFCKYLDTDFAMYCLSLVKMNCNNNTGEWSYIPEIDWSDSDMSDSRFIKEFGLTQQEVEYIHEEMKNYGWKVYNKKNVNIK